MDDGTIFRLGQDDFRLCSYQRADEWQVVQPDLTYPAQRTEDIAARI